MRYDGPRVLPAIVAARAAEQPDRRVIRFETGSLTYRELDERSRATAAALHGLGLRRGDTVATLFLNGPEAIDVWLACARLGVVEVPLNVELKSDQLVDIVTRARCRLIVADPELTSIAVDAERHRLPAVVTELPPAGVPVTDAVLDPSDHSVILFTSGTTGPSKGVQLTHRANFRLAETVVDGAAMREGEVLFTAFPLFHVAARFVSVLAAMIVDGEVVVHRRFSATRFWDICRAEGVTAIHLLGTLPAMLLNQPERPDDADNPVRLSYGAALTKATWEPFERRFGLRNYELYGSTEQGAVTMTTDAARKVGTCGRALADVDLEIHDEYDEPVPAGVEGEIVVRPREPGIFFTGYFDMPEATVRSWRNLWFHTGDGGWLDEEGYLTFTGRLKDAIRRRGENISAWEVERVLDAFDGIEESAVIGVPSPLGEEEVLAVVAAPKGIDLDELLAHCRAHLARFAVPRYVRVVSQLPKTATGRVEKYRLARVDDDTVDLDGR